MDTEKYMKKLIEKLHIAESYHEVQILLGDAVIDGDIIQKDDYITYICGDYMILDRLRFGSEHVIEELKVLSKKIFSIFPQYVDSICIDDYCILITRIPGMNGKELIPIYKGYSLLSEEEKSCAYRDVQRLVEAGLYSNAISRGDYNWFLTADTHHLFVPFWGLALLNNAEEGKKILRNVHYILFKKALEE